MGNSTELERKLRSYFEIMNVWLEMRQKGHTLARYMSEQGYNKIAVYGMQELGHRLLDELSGTEIKVEYVIDKNQVLGDFVLLSPDEELPKVDAIIVTADFYYSEIKEELGKKCDYPILSLRALIGNAYHRIF